MTISTLIRKTIAAGDGVTTAFNFAFQVRSAADLQVYYTDAAGQLTLLASNLYSVVLNPVPSGQLWAAGGTVTYPLVGSAIAAGTTLTISRNIALLQSSSLINQGGYFADVVEAALDVLTMEMQQVTEVISRALTLPISSSATTQLPNPLANAAIGWDATGTFITNIVNAGNLALPVAIAQGGTASVTAAAARLALGDASVIAAGRNISARTNAVTPNTKVDVAADEFLVEDATGALQVLKTLAVTVDFGVVGAGGIDAGVQALSTWYYLWAIAKADGTKSAVGSISATAPTMPAGYTFKGLISAVRSSAGNTFVPYRQFGNRVYYEQRLTVGATLNAVVETVVSMTTMMPPIAEAVTLYVNMNVTTNAGAGQSTFILRLFSGAGTYFGVAAGDSFAAASAFNNLTADVPNIAQSFYYLMSNAGSLTTGNADVYALGFKLPLGGQ